VKGDRKVPLIVDFYATWCGPCILMAQELEMVPWILITQLSYTFSISLASCVDSRMLIYFQTLALGTRLFVIIYLNLEM